MRKIVSVALAAAMSFGACNVLLAACGDDEKDAPYFDKETVFHVDLSMSTAIGPLGTLCEPGTITFRTDGTATFDVPFTDAALVMMDNLLGFRIPTFKHEDTYELNEDETAIIYHSTRKDFEEPQTLELETLSDGSWKFVYDISVQIPGTQLYFYSNEAMMPDQNPEPEPDPEPEPEPETYEVSFDAGEGVVFEEGYTLPEDTSYDEVTEITLPEAKFTKEGNAFRGWAANGKIYEYGENYLYQPGDKVTIDTDIDFVAVWSDSFHVTITKGPDGKGNVGDLIMPDTLYGKYVYLPANPYDYKDYSKGFAGWTDGKGKVVQPGGMYKVTEDVVFEPVWAEFVEVTFKADIADEGGFVIEAPAGSQFVLPAASFVGADDKGFAGWQQVKDDGSLNTSVKRPGDKVTAAEGMTFVAKTEKTVTITFDANGGTGKAPEAIVAGNNLYFVFPECELTKDGYVFNGWGTSATAKSGSMPGARAYKKADTTYYAVWRQLRTVSFETGIEGKTIDSVEQGEGMKITLPEMPYENGNKLFDGWSDGSKLYQPGASYTVAEGKDTAFTAVWRDLVTVEFNGGEGVTGSVENIEVYQSKSFTLPENNFVKPGSIFGGWSDGENNYMPGDTYTIAEDSAAKVTFDAVWNEGTPFADYTVIFRAGQTSEVVYKDAEGKDVTLNNFFPSGSMTELVLRPDLTADFVVKSTLSEKDFNTHNEAGKLGLTLEKFQENFTIDKKNISYDYDAATGVVTLNLGDGEKLELKIVKTAKNDKIDYDNVQFEFALKNKIGQVEKLTFAAIDGQPKYFEEAKTFTGKLPEGVPTVGGMDVTLTVNTDGTGKLKVFIMNMDFTHQLTADGNTIIWLGSEGDRLEGKIGKTEDGKMTVSVTLMGVTLTLTEQA